jgi:HAD superfamily hydrolase (TIGR01509 family)
MSFDEEIINELVGKRVEAELELGSCVELRDGALDLLSSLKVKVKLALASMNNKQVIENMLNSCGLKDFFDVVLSADEVSEPKPDPEIFLKCASKLRLKPAIIVVVEDSTFGVRAAKAANMNCIAVISGVSDRNELELEKPDLIIGSVKEKEKNSEIRAQLKKMNPILNGVIVCVEHVKNAWYVLANYSLWVEYVCTQEQVEISPATPSFSWKICGFGNRKNKNETALIFLGS